jgi:glutamyl-Q tRNA(Asp) synthetase
VYRGRFAPSPTGHLHFGSLVAALGSYLDARSVGGEWLVRMEDVDLSRCRDEYASSILRTLEGLGLHWDGAVEKQSERSSLYNAALESLRPWTYLCSCTRREAGEVYDGRCRAGAALGRQAKTLRIEAPKEHREFEDRRLGVQRGSVAAAGDFVLRNSEGHYSYQLAVVVDDAEQRISDVVRGEDLLEATARQIYLQELLGYPRVRYLHLPLARDAAGQKLSKQNRADPIDARHGGCWIAEALRFLGQRPVTFDEPARMLAQASAQWNWQWNS